MKSKVLILSKRYNEDSFKLYQAALKQNWQVWRFERHIPQWVIQSTPVIYCETAFADYLAQELKLTLLTPNDAILAKLPFKYLQRKIQFTTYQHFVRPTENKFIKPADYKYFPAGIYGQSDTIPGFDYCQPDDPILISDVVNFTDEYRFFILNNEIQTASLYVENATLTTEQNLKKPLDANLMDFAIDVIDSIKSDMPQSYVLDIGLLSNGKYAVIEFNPTWASGIYAADPDKVLACVAAAVASAEQQS